MLHSVMLVSMHSIKACLKVFLVSFHTLYKA